MSSRAIFYHAGCPVCVEAEQKVAYALDKREYDVEVVHLGNQKSRIAEAEAVGVKSGPRAGVGRPAVSHQFRRGNFSFEVGPRL